MNLPRLISDYGDEHTCREYLEGIRWPDGVKCPRDQKNATWLGTVEAWECNSCHYQFTVRVGTVLQDSKLPLSKWLIAVFLIAESKKGMSANQLRRTLGTTYKTAWYICHRIRNAMASAESARGLTGRVEMDETFIGGKPRFKQGRRRGQHPHAKKTMVLGAVERGGEIRLQVELRRTNREVLHQFVAKTIDDAAPHIYTDGAPAYADLTDADTTHEKVNHLANEWVRGDVHTNTIESAWSLFKRSILGSYHHLSVKHLDAYLDEFGFRYNNRHNDYLFRDTLRALVKSDVLTYKALTERFA
jgi:transposase-like protein